MSESVPDQVTDPEGDSVVERIVEPIVRARILGPVVVEANRVRVGAIASVPLTTTEWTHVLGPDPRRRRAILAAYLDADGSAVAFRLNRSRQGTGILWPSAATPLVVEHSDEIYAQLPAGAAAATLSVIAESSD